MNDTDAILGKLDVIRAPLPEDLAETVSLTQDHATMNDFSQLGKVFLIIGLLIMIGGKIPGLTSSPETFSTTDLPISFKTGCSVSF